MRDRLFDIGPQLMLVTTFPSYIAINIDSYVFDTLHLIKIILQGYHSEFFIGIGFFQDLMLFTTIAKDHSSSILVILQSSW